MQILRDSRNKDLFFEHQYSQTYIRAIVSAASIVTEITFNVFLRGALTGALFVRH